MLPASWLGATHRGSGSPGTTQETYGRADGGVRRPAPNSSPCRMPLALVPTVSMGMQSWTLRVNPDR